MSSAEEAMAMFGAFVIIYVLFAFMLTVKMGMIAGLSISFAVVVILGTMFYLIKEEVF